VIAAFQAEVSIPPAITLRGGEALDDYSTPPPYDPIVDQPSDDYLERYAYYGVNYLDPASWRHYLPPLVDYAYRHWQECSSMVVNGLLHSLRPPDRDPPRLESLSAEQEAAMQEFLEDIVLGGPTAHDRDFASRILEEWWLPNSLYRPRE
jgi:hypothetical protein